MTYQHIDVVVVKAHFASEQGRRFRYRLEVVKTGASASGKTVCVVMQNPSNADEHIADRSVQFMERLIFEREHPAFENVCRMIVVNQFALVQTAEFKGNQADVGKDNDEEIEKAVRESDIVILGWGASNPFDLRKCKVLGLLINMQGKTIYRTRVHPSRASDKDMEFIQPVQLS